MIDLSNDVTRYKLTLQIQADVDAYCRETFAEDARTHLGASIIGHDCLAYLWNTFRWLKFDNPTGQQLRLFNRGHEEEKRFVRWLTGIGFQVREFDPETKKQFRIIGAKGHFGGSLDSLMKAPERYELDLLIWLGEFKTHNEKSFAKLAGPKLDWKQLKIGILRKGGQGVRRSKPVHYKQMCSYGRAYQLHWGLYCAVNKETDELYFEIVELDWSQADDLFRKAESVIFSRAMPPKIAQTETYLECSWCLFAGICHRGEVPIKNCRSCARAVPVENGEWYCEHPEHQAIIPKEIIVTGCNLWARIT